MYSSELTSAAFRTKTRVSSNLRPTSHELKLLSFEEQSFYLTQLIFNRARLLYQDDQKAEQLTALLDSLDAQDVYDVVDAISDDRELQRWIQELMDSYNQN